MSLFDLSSTSGANRVSRSRLSARTIETHRPATSPNFLEGERLRRFKAYDRFMNATERRWPPGFSSNLHTYILEFDHLGIKNKPCQTDRCMAAADLTFGEIEELQKELRQRMRSLTRCINEFQRKTWVPDVDLYTSKTLEETYHTESQITPPWFRALLLDGPRTFELMPTFPLNVQVLSTEYRELSEAKFKITISFVNNVKGIHGGIFVSENLIPKSSSCSRLDLDSSDTIGAVPYSRKPSEVHRMSSSDFDGETTRLFERNSQSKASLPSNAIFSNQSGIVLQPTNNTSGDWLTSYCFTATPLQPMYKRRVILTGKFEVEDAISSFEKSFRIIIMLGEDNQTKGIYRRQMTSEDSFLTWKIIFS